MRKPLLLTLFLVQSGLTLVANAAPPGDPFEPGGGPPPVYTDEEAPPAPPAAQAAPAAPAPTPAQPAPQPSYFNGPVYIIPAWPTQPQVAPSTPLPPATVAPQPVVTARAATPVPRPQPEALRHRFGIGARATGMWINQRLYNADMLMMGGGAVARVRIARPFGLEASFDVVKRDIHSGVFERVSYPVQVAALLSLMPPRAGTHFNVYGAVGGGVMPSRIQLDDRLTPRQELTATELMGQVGVGCELRLWRLSLTADARAIGLYRTGEDAYFQSFIRPDSGPNSLGLRQAPVADRSFGWTFGLGAMLWL